MTNRKNHYFLVLLTALFFADLANAQKPPAPAASTNANFYVKVYGGYGLLTPGSYLIQPSTTNNGTGNSTFSSSAIGVGAGLHYGGGIGFIASDFINLGVDADYLNGKKLTETSSFTNVNTPYANYSETINHSVLSIIPNITFKALSKPSYYIYNRIGLVLSINTKLNVNYSDTVSSTSGGNTFNDRYIYEYTYKFGLNLGVQAAIGVQFNIAGNLRGFAEIVGNYLPTKPTTAKVVNTYIQSENGVAQPTSINNYNYTYKKSGTFSNTSTPNSTNGYDYNYTEPPTVFNINYIGINIGVAYKF